MATSDSGQRTTGVRGGRVRRTPPPGRKQLLGAVAMIIVGSFLPWVDTAVGAVSGTRGAGLWTFYAAMLGLAGALVPWRRAAVVQGVVLAAAATLLPVWQVVHALRLVGTEGWAPGPGLVVTFGGGVVAAVAVRALLRGERVTLG